jgi:hypothetical protein
MKCDLVKEHLMVVMVNCIILKYSMIEKRFIVFKREEFGWVFRSMMKQIGYINDIDLKLSSLDEYKLIGLWPQIMERIHIIDVNIEDFLMQEPIQTHLDAYLFNQTKFSSPEPLESGVKVAEKPLGIDWFK